MPLPNLTPATLQHHVTEPSYSRGESYFRSGAVVSLTQRQQTLQAEVEGNEVMPYRVTIDFDGGGVTHAVVIDMGVANKNIAVKLHATWGRLPKLTH